MMRWLQMHASRLMPAARIKNLWRRFLLGNYRAEHHRHSCGGDRDSIPLKAE